MPYKSAAKKRAHERKYQKVWMARMSDSNRKEYRRKMRVPRKQRLREQQDFRLYGVTPEAKKDMLIAQDNSCAICKQAFGNTRATAPCIDHDHETKEVRKLLCRQCNLGIANLKEDPDVVRAAADYLDAFKKGKTCT